jgi:RNA polymerase sigma-70 factor (ECF subfamily)
LHRIQFALSPVSCNPLPFGYDEAKPPISHHPPGGSIDRTPATLLERLRGAADEAAWSRFVRLYTPLLFSWARRSGVSEHDAADLLQEVFVALLQTLPSFEYDHERGRFRGWLRTLLLNKLRDRKRRDAREEKALTQHGQQAEQSDDGERFWEAEYQQELARRALRLMESDFAPATWKAFWETVVQGRSADVVAGELGLTPNAVYIARCRVLRCLRQELGGLAE